MVLRLFRRKDPVVGKTAVAADGSEASKKGSTSTQSTNATGAGTSVLESAQPQNLKSRRASEAGKGSKPAPKPARKTKQPSKKVAKKGASGKATKPKRGR